MLDKKNAVVGVPDPTVFARSMAKKLWLADKEYGSAIASLQLEWTLDYYLVNELERRTYPRFLEVHAALTDGGHTSRKPFEYFRGEAFYVPHEKWRIMVSGPDDEWPKYLVVDECNGIADTIWQDFRVRKIWPRFRKDQWSVRRPTLAFYAGHDFDIREAVKYGDCRDPGHVLTYRNIGGRSHCDHVMWDIGEPLHWCFQLGCLWTELCQETQESEKMAVIGAGMNGMRNMAS